MTSYLDYPRIQTDSTTSLGSLWRSQHTQNLKNYLSGYCSIFGRITQLYQKLYVVTGVDIGHHGSLWPKTSMIDKSQSD